MLFAYIILNYKTIDLTVSAVKHIRENVTGDKIIIVVDNHSQDSSDEKILQLETEFEEVHSVLLAENLGFSQGNNAGIEEAKKFNPDFFVIMNNDTVILQEDFQTRVVTDFYNNDNVGILGPDILINGSTSHQNPKGRRLVSHEKAEKMLSSSQKLMRQNDFVLGMREKVKSLQRVKQFVRNFKDVASGNKSQTDYKRPKVGTLVLHGSFFIVPRSTIMAFGELLDNRPFFYMEMEILAVRLSKLGLDSLYDPDIKVVHEQNASTNVSFDTAVKKVRFQAQQMANSLEVYLKILGENRKDGE